MLHPWMSNFYECSLSKWLFDRFCKTLSSFIRLQRTVSTASLNRSLCRRPLRLAASLATNMSSHSVRKLPKMQVCIVCCKLCEQTFVWYSCNNMHKMSHREFGKLGVVFYKVRSTKTRDFIVCSRNEFWPRSCRGRSNLHQDHCWA